MGRRLAAWNSHRAEDVLALLSEDVEVRDDSWPFTMHGHDDVRSFLQALWRAMPDMAFELISGPYVIPGEPRAACLCAARSPTIAQCCTRDRVGRATSRSREP